MDVRFAETGARDFDEPRALLKRLQALAPRVSHAGLQATDELEDAVRKQTLIRHPAFNALGHELCPLLFMGLKIAILAAPLHGADGAHAAVELVASALIQNGLPGALFRAREQ